MATVTEVHITAGVPDTGTGEVSTLDALCGTAGTASTKVQTVQGIASMTPVQVSQATASNLNAQAVGNVASGAADSGNPVKAGGKYNSAAPTLTDGNRGDLQLDVNGNLKVSLVASPVTVSNVNISQVGGNSVATDNGASSNATQRVTIANNSTGVLASIGSITSSIVPGTGATNLGKAIDTATGATDTGVLALATRDDALTTLTPADGDNVQLRTDSTGRLWASATIDAALPAGTNNIGDVDVLSVVPGTGATNLGKAEDAGHTSGDVGVMPLGVANTALAALSGTTLDYTPIATNLDGRAITVIAPPAAMVRGTASVTDTTSTSVIAASGDAGLRTYVTGVQCANTGSTTVLITLQDGSGGTALQRTIAPAGGGSNITFDVPLITSLNTALFFAAGGSSSTVYVSAQGYKAP